MFADPRVPVQLLPPLATAVIKAQPQDFKVSERLTFEPSGRGEHLFFHIQKIGVNSHEVATELAELCHVRARRYRLPGAKTSGQSPISGSVCIARGWSVRVA